MERQNKAKNIDYSMDIEDDSSNDSNYDSLKDNESFLYDSDEDYMPLTKNRSKAFRKRLQNENGDTIKVFRNNSTSSEGGNFHVQRMPTRRPDPNVSNRNALMARENRKRKKEHIIQMEKEIYILKSNNKKMKKALKEQNVLIKKLSHEKLYLRSVIANRTEIMHLLNTLQGNKLPMTSSVTSFITNNNNINKNNNIMDSIKCERKSCSLSPSQSEISTTSSLSYNGPEVENDFLVDDFEASAAHAVSPSNQLGDWDKLFPLNFDNISDIPSFESEDNFKMMPQQKEIKTEIINSEHNYSNNFTINLEKPIIKPGICFHIASGRVSLEFCNVCHQNAQSAWIEEI